MGKLALAVVIVGSLALVAGPSSAYDIDLGPLGHACDTCGGGVIGGLPVVGHTLNEAAAQAGGLALQQWIQASRDSAVGSSMPVPPHIRQQLAGYISDDALNRARYKIGDAGFANLAARIEAGNGNVMAVTLIDVIVFRGPTEANNPALWAHELTHVEQYRDWGVRDFAIRYVRDHGVVENPAYDRENRYWAWAQSRGVGPGPAPGPLPGPMPVAQVGAFCYTPAGRFGPGPIQPVGAPCSVGFPGNPPILGQIGP